MRRFIAVPLLLLVAVLPSACGGGVEVAAPPSSAPAIVAPSPSASASPAPESAKDFIRRFTAVEDAMQNSGDTSAYAALADGCESCNSLIAKVKAIYAAGGNIRYAGTRILWIHQRGDQSFSYRVQVGPTHYRESGTGRMHVLKGGRVTFEIDLRRTDSSWVATRTAAVAGSAG